MTDDTNTVAGIVGNQQTSGRDATSDRDDWKAKLDKYRFTASIMTFLIILFVMGVTWHWTMTKGIGLSFGFFILAFAMRKIKGLSEFAKPVALIGTLFLIASPFFNQTTRDVVWALDKYEQCGDPVYADNNAADCAEAQKILDESKSAAWSRDYKVTPHWEDEVKLGDPMDLGHGVRPDLNSVRGYTCPTMTTVYEIPNGFIVDTTDTWFTRVVIDYFDKKGRKTTQEAHGYRVAKKFQLCVKYERDNGEQVPLVWTRSPE